MEPAAGGRALAGMGNDANGVTEEAVQRIIRDLTTQGKSPHYVTVEVGSATHYFSPHDTVARTAQALVVQTPRRLYAWKIDRAPIVRYSTWARSIGLNEIPFAASKTVDDAVAAAAKGKLTKNVLGDHICHDCDVLFGRTPPNPGSGASGQKVTDPWQVTAQSPSGSQRTTATYISCDYDINGAHCTVSTDMGAYLALAPQYYYDPSTTGTGATIPVPAPPCAVAIGDATLQQAYNNRTDIQAVAQAVASRNANHAPPNVVVQRPPAADAKGAAAYANVNNTTITFFPDNYQPYFKAGMNLADMLLHEMLHLWYETKGSDGHRPNPLPNDPGFNAHPVVQFTGTDSSSGAQVTVTLRFDLLNSSGQLDAKQYAGYEHALIHDDVVQAKGGDDGAWTSLTDAMAAATSVQVGSGTPAKINATTAQTIMLQNKLKGAGIANRAPRRPPTWPDFNAGCALTATSQVRQPRSTGTPLPSSKSAVLPVSSVTPKGTSGARRKADLDNPVVTYNLDGYDLIWDGVPPVPPPPVCDAIDPMGYCSYNTYTEQWVVPCPYYGASYVQSTYHYLIYQPNGTVSEYDFNTRQQDDGSSTCWSNQYWTPDDPAVEFNDGYLP